ncbi:MAG: SurA N-terminal domain-containing protein [Janthinobacterium lividum]
MLSAFRKFLNTRAARLFFFVLIIPFVLWGVADVVRNMGQETALATVGGRKIEAPEFQEAFRQQLAQATRQLGGRTEATPAIRRAVAAQTLDRLIFQAAIADEVRRLGITVPDEALRQAVFEIPAFRGRSGGFDRATFENVLRQNNYTEGRFLEQLRVDLAQRQLMEAVQVGVGVPQALLKPIYAFSKETRVAEVVDLPFVAAAEPPEPTEADLRRAYADDPARYAAPAYRHIKAVVITPDTIARDIEVPDADVAAFYEQHKAEFGSAEKRSLQVLVAQDETVARRLDAQWKAGADWATIQKAAADAGASAAELDDAVQADIPGTELGQAAFAAAAGTVVGPVKSEFGWQVLRVTKVTPGSEKTLDSVRDELRTRIARERAVDQVYSRINRLEDVLSSGASFDEIPADLGATVLGGTLDAQGNTKDGEPAPLPGTPALRQAILTAAFALPKGEPPKLTEGPDQSYFALTVDDETPPAPRPFDAVQAQVRENYEADARRKEQETVAARLLAATKAGGSLADAATVAGLRVERTQPIARSTPTAGVPPALIQPVFGLKPGETTMVETPQGFLVARLAEVSSPDPAADPAAAAQVRTALNQALTQDVEVTYASALRERARPTVNRTLLESLSQ